MQQDIQSYIQAGQQARDYYNKNTTKPEVKKDTKDKEDDAINPAVLKLRVQYQTPYRVH